MAMSPVPIDPFPKRISQIVRSVERGILTRQEGSRLLLDKMSPDNVAEALRLIPEQFHDDIKERVRQMPVSAWDWHRPIRMEFFCGRNPPKVFGNRLSESLEKKPVGDALRSYYRERGIVLERADPTPLLELSIEEILNLYDDWTGERRNYTPLSEAVAIHVFAWRKSGAQWERPENFASDLSWCPAEAPRFIALGDALLGMLWGALNCFHPWVYRDESGRAIRWADVSLTSSDSRRESLDYVDVFLNVCRGAESAGTNDCATAIRTGKNFQIQGAPSSEVLCKALLIAKKCRQNDPGPMRNEVHRPRL